MKLPLLLASLVLGASSASASVTLQFNTTEGSLQNFALPSGVGGASLVWGILIDTAGNGFSHDSADPGIQYDFFGTTFTGGVVQTLNLMYYGSPSGTTDDVLYLAELNMSVQSAEFDGMPAGTNRVTSIAGVPYGSNGISAGDPFAVVWFNRTTVLNGDPIRNSLAMRYGGLNHPGFVIQEDGSTTFFAGPFAGPDPLKLMNYASGPEPSTMLLGLLGAVSLLRRRRGV